MKHSLSALGLKSKLAVAVKVAAATNTRQKVRDGDGLMLVVRPSGAAAWVWRYMVASKRSDMTLGAWPTVTLQMARELAAKHRFAIATGADDPATAARETKAATRAEQAASADTVRRMYEDWITRQKHESSTIYRSNIEAAFRKDVFPAIGGHAPHTVTRDAIIKIMRGIEERGALVMVRRVRMWLRELFEFGTDDETRPLLIASPVPLGTLKSFKSRRTGNFAAITDIDEIPALLAKIKQVNSWVNRMALLLSAHLFPRPTELRASTWAEFDLPNARWTIPASRMKGGEEHWVPLSPQVLALLRVHQGVVGSMGWLFPGRRYDSPISEGTLTSCLNACGYEGRHTPHGFRAMARTTLDEHLKVDVRFIEKQLAHEIDTRLRGAYNRSEYWDGRVAMMAAWSTWLEQQQATARE